MPSSHASLRRSMSIVRLAFVGSVMCRPPSVPPVRFQMHQVSMFPKMRSPASARSRVPSTLSRIQRTFGPEKYVASGRPTCAWKRSWPPSRESPSTSLVVRVPCDQVAARRVRAVFLPHDRVHHGLAGVAVPHDGGLALVGDPQARDVVGARAGRLDRPVAHLLGARPDLLRVVLDPPRLRIDLLVLLLRDADDVAAVVEDH